MKSCVTTILAMFAISVVTPPCLAADQPSSSKKVVQDNASSVLQKMKGIEKECVGYGAVLAEARLNKLAKSRKTGAKEIDSKVVDTVSKAMTQQCIAVYRIVLSRYFKTGIPAKDAAQSDFDAEISKHLAIVETTLF